MKHAGEELVALVDIGRLLGVSKQRASQLAAKDGFPTPIGELAGSRIWRWSDIEKWRTAAAARASKPRQPADA